MTLAPLSRGFARALFAIAIASLVLNVVTVALLVRVGRPVQPRALAPTPPAPAISAQEQNLLPIRPAFAFKRAWQYRDQETGKERTAILTDDTPKLARFVSETHLSPAEEQALRNRYAARLAEETALAQQMAAAGRWDEARVLRLLDHFWATEFERLSPAQKAGLSPEFFPVQ